MSFNFTLDVRGGYAMNNTRDNTPSMDYEELRRRHERFKQRTASQTPAQPKSTPVQKPQAKPVIEEPAVEEKAVPVQSCCFHILHS